MATFPETRPAAAGQGPRVGHSRVAVVFTRPETVLEDYRRVMELADCESFLPKGLTTLLKINISWQHYYPACSTTPWQLEGVIKALNVFGYPDLVPTHNGTVVVDAREGAFNNKHQVVEEKYGLESLHLEETRWIDFRPKSEMLVLDKVYPDGFQIPEALKGKNIVHLPTVKTHVFTTMTGAMKNAFGGLLNHRRHWTHSVIHETLVDLLQIQKEIHPGLFAVVDGTLAGDGPGPRAMRWHEKNVILAGGDQVAVDAVSAKLMGFDPMNIPFIRIAHEMGLGCGLVKDIEVVGADVSEVDWGFTAGENTFFSLVQKLVYRGPLRPIEYLLVRSPLITLGIFASNFYHNGYWLPLVGRKRVIEALKTDWGKLFKSY